MVVKNPTIVTAIFFLVAFVFIAAYFVQSSNAPAVKSIPRKPPWNSDDGGDSYLDNLKHDIDRRFPKGTDIAALESYMLGEGFKKSEECPYIRDLVKYEHDKTLCFWKNFDPDRKPDNFIYGVAYGNDNKIIDTGFTRVTTF